MMCWACASPLLLLFTRFNWGVVLACGFTASRCSPVTHTRQNTLADGVILCKLVRDLSGNQKIRFTDPSASAGGGGGRFRGARRGTATGGGGSVGGGVYAMNENIQAFSKECRRRGLDSVVTLSPADLRDGGNPGKVMACLMNL